jgi:WD40 repeat protein
MRLLSGYQKPVLSLAVSSDGKRLYSAAKGQTLVWEWDLASGAVARKLPGARGHDGILAMVVTRGGENLFSVGERSTLIATSLSEGEGRTAEQGDTLARTSPKGALAASHDGSRLAVHVADWMTGQDWIQFMSLPDGLPTERLLIDSDDVTALAFSPNDALLAAVFADEVRLFDVTPQKRKRTLDPRPVSRITFPKAAITRISFRPDGRALACATGKAVTVWDVTKGEPAATLSEHKSKVTALAYSPDGKYLASADKDGVVILHDARTHAVVSQRPLDVGAILALVWLPDSSAFAAGGNKVIALCETQELLTQPATKPQSRGEPLSLSGHTTHVDALAYSPDGKTLASAEKQLVRLWDLSGGAGQAREKGSFVPGDYPSVTMLSWSPNSRRLILCDPTQIHDGATGAVLSTPDGRHLSCLPSGRLLLIDTLPDLLSGVRVCLLDEQGKAEMASATVTVPQRKEDYVYHTGAGPDGRNCYFSYSQNTVYRWDTKTGATDAQFTQDTRIEGLRVGADERQLVTWGGNRVMVWSLPDGKKRLDLKHPLQASGAAFLPDGRLLTSCYDGLVRAWDLSGGSEIQALDLGMGKLYSLAVSPDHMTFAAGVQKKWRIVLMDVPE